MRAGSVVVLLAILAGCSSRHLATYSYQTASQTTVMRDYCETRNISSETITRADSLEKVGAALHTQGKYEKALPLLQQAVVLYKNALSSQEHQQSQKEIAALQEQIDRTKKRLAEYTEILAELKRMEGAE